MTFRLLDVEKNEEKSIQKKEEKTHTKKSGKKQQDKTKWNKHNQIFP